MNVICGDQNTYLAYDTNHLNKEYIRQTFEGCISLELLHFTHVTFCYNRR